MLLAGEHGDDGALQPVPDMAWRLRTSEQKLTESLEALSTVGVVQQTPSGWVVTNFKKRQYSPSMDRTRRYRDRHSDASQSRHEVDDDSVSVSVSESVSLEEGGVGGETSPPSSVEAEFTAHFGSFNGKRERQRWQVIVEAVGFEQAQKIAAWAERKEIHMVNRGGLMDSLETAAKKWTDKPASKLKGDRSEFLKALEAA